ncbi:MAG: autotransporter outer membrane beta-barrel domain-containing protein [Rubellimicrobium sp.]|nr:autotransporter outer membrane beta-barrel domain-containing protein [Rubellimicrobium sp.]
MGQEVTNPATGDPTTVSGFLYDPAGTPTAGNVAFVRTADGYTFLVKTANQTFYNNDTPPVAYHIDSISSSGVATVTVTSAVEGQDTLPTFTMATVMNAETYTAYFVSTGSPGEVTPAVNVTGPDGVQQVVTGNGGSNGHAGALVVPPGSGGRGQDGPGQTVTLNADVNATTRHGWEVGSVGGKGGNGGNSYLNVWSGRPGGDGGAGGTVNATQGASSDIVTSGANHYGIFAYSRSGRAGNGGSGYGAPGGGQGGHSSDGGSVTVNQYGHIQTSGDASHGIFALSVSNNGGDSGSQWGLGGSSSAGGTGGNGGAVNVITHGGATILTTGDFAVGILGQSVGGTGGSAGSSNNLIVSLPGSGAMGGTGGTVSITNGGTIETQGLGSHGILAQSLGGSGGSGGGAWGLVALGGQGDAGGSGSAVTVTNGATGSILTGGAGAYGILAQSIGGSGGSGSNAGGLVAIGGNGAGAGNGAAVTVSNLGRIETTGERARGIVAQSIGGGGGDGGNTGGMVSVGGRGGAGGAGGAVSVTNDGVIVTAGDDATGILAQSVGGGGGNGGSAGAVGAFVGVAVGGTGGSGGNGGEVTVALTDTDATQPSSIRTEGDRAYGVIAQSVGGGGGNGGGAVSVAVGYIGAAAVAVGGSGGSGGAGGKVTLTGGGATSIQTGGADSIGVLAQSVGGGGGNGGYAVSVALAGGETVAAGLAVSVGGSGGSGGAGGNVLAGTLTGTALTGAGLEGSVLTTGERSAGVVLQSVGGGGGNGGLSVAVSGAAAGAVAGNVSVAVGGAGSVGGAGGEVRGRIDADVTTKAGYSTGILAQSVGGGGGNGGGSIAAGISGAGAGAGAISVGVGGAGASASSGGLVELIAGGDTIRTEGAFSTGIIAQSIGGGGGNGGYSVAASAAGAGTGAGAINVGLGGAGGGGGAGGNVTATVSANVTTLGANSGAILAQSVGGGGGNGGFNVTAGIAGAGTGAGAISVGLGGAGGAGGHAGTVTATVTGNVETTGARSAGVVAQSIGGGGGNGGFSVSAAGAGAGTGAGAVAVGLGGGGGTGGNAASVTADVSGTILTRGFASGGLVAQSIGGGGGNGGFSVDAALSGAGTGAGAVGVGLGGSGAGGGAGGSVTATARDAIETQGASSAGFLAQSVGGGGGAGGFNVTAGAAGAGTGAGAIGVGLGGSGAGGGAGGKVTATANGTILTDGFASAGFIAQSIGGGGGSGGFNVSAAIAGAGEGAGAISVGLGGSGGGGGNGGTVTATTTSGVETHGAASVGILAQSVGGGGGSGGFDVSAGVAGAGESAGAISVGLGGSGAGGGSGGSVTLDVTNDVRTQGAYSGAVIAQSIGGGGGSGGFNVSGAGAGAGTGAAALGVGIGGGGGAGSSGGAVTSHVTGTLVTAGAHSGGLLVQSVGGGGGSGGMNISGALSFAGTGSGAVAVGIGGWGGAGGTGGVVGSTYAGETSTTGAWAPGLVAQSIGGGGGNGGMNIASSISVAPDVSVGVSIGVGGFGGSGGAAGNVTHDATGHVRTAGADSTGVLTQSLGGGGGNGGMNVSGSVTLAKDAGAAIGIGIGGFGGGGADAGASTQASFTGGVRTAGARSSAIITQSIGGGGGNGGIDIAGAVNLSKGSGGAATFGLGGFGGGAGNGGAVTSRVTAGTTAGDAFVTLGDHSTAILAQSLGGGGGVGGLNVSGAVNVTGQSGAAVALGVGGFGGGGGNSAAVTLDVTGDVATFGNRSDGVVAQSLGGGGGNGGVNISGAVDLSKPGGGSNAFSVAIGVGGFGGDGGDAGNVHLGYTGTLVAQPRTLDSNGNVTGVVNAGQASGLIAQSVGGGGGNGGINVSAGVTINNKPGSGQSSGQSYAVLVGLGGFGGGGGDAGNVDVAVGAGSTIVAHGIGASGIFAQSVGGGGGNGGLNVSGGIVSDSSFIAGVGGFGGDGGTAGDVSVTARADITVSTDPAAIVDPDAIDDFERKLRGLFGDGVMNELVNSAVDGIDSLVASKGLRGLFVDLGLLRGDAPPETEGSAGLLAQSIGGGGGNGGLNVSGGIALSRDGDIPSITFGIGGFGGAGNTSGDVTVVQEGTITVAGNWKHGILAQSIGGGGGNGGLNVSGQLNWEGSGKSNGATDLSIVAGLGGWGGGGARAGDVSVTSTGAITTNGYHARGIFAQSIGGGGGTGGINVTAVGAKDSSPVAIGVGGFGGSGDDAGNVIVLRGTADAAAGRILTNGNGSHGIEASSIGGGGGDAGVNAVIGVSKTSGSSSGGGGGGSGERNVPTNTGVDDSVISNYNAVLDQLEGRTGTAPSGGGSSNSTNSAVIAVGGSAGNAGNGGTVEVTEFGDIETLGERSHGIIAQSIGGGGGNAAMNLGLIFELGEKGGNRGFGLAVGGAGGEGGTGGAVTVSHTGDILTHGQESWGIFAQSVGGGGGNASWDSLTQGGEGGNIGIVIGREGGTGGAAGDVSVTSNGQVVTIGDRSHGIFAQSIGNGGGNSGTVGVTVGRAGTEDRTGNTLGMKVGLQGGTGGSAGAVSVTADGLVFTHGDDARGIFAQSVGGGGGTGGAAGGGAAGANANSYSISVGGTGGSGGLSGPVTVTSLANIGTLGARSEGIFAQSVGGGGGTGGAVSSGLTVTSEIVTNVKGSATGTTVSVNIGGSGGSGMHGGAVTVSSAGRIGTAGEGSHGIRAQSVGGGGGDSGLVENRIVNLRSEIDTTVNFSIGGAAGSGAAGGAVGVTNTGGILTAGDRAAGIVAQSVGGGGGNAGHVQNIIVGAEAANSTRNAFLIGGAGGTGGTGGAVTVTNEAAASIWTLGAESYGIFAQSVGGGGGSGSDVQNFSVVTKGSGDTAQSLNLAIGGSGGTGGAGGLVAVTNAGLIHTEGARAHGILAQSVGGGGGNGGTTITGTVRLKPGTEADPSLALALGGSGGTGGVGGTVNVANSGTIEVLGDGAFGILAQSVGGGGGNGGMAVNLTLSGLASLKDPVSQLSRVALGGSGGTGADGGDVTVTNSGSIYVGGDNGYGILAQSVGGGGGNAGLSVSTSLLSVADSIFNTALGARDGTSGTAGKVTVHSTGDIIMEGAGGQAILAQSVNGGGGNVDVFLDFAPVGEEPEPGSDVTDILYNLAMGAVGLKAGAAGSDVSQTHTGNITSTGAGSAGSQIQSIGGGGGNARLTVLGTGDNGFDFSAVLGAVETDNAGGGNLGGSHTGNIFTTGGQSTGALGQSIGGGGGSLLLAASGGTGKVTLGADPSYFNAGGAIDRSFDGNVTTSDVRSIAHLVQSIGAGGGLVLSTGLDHLYTTIGATDGSTGDGGAVTYAITGDVLTFGERSHGVVLQSIGGGGGMVLSDLAPGAVTVTPSSNNGGSGGAITLTSRGHVAVEGADAVGILAQSLGGGGGSVDAVFRGSAGGAGSGGAISLTQAGNVMATGEGGIAVMAQSAGADGAGGNISVALDGVVIGGSGDGEPGAAGAASGGTAAIVIDGGATNTVTLGADSFLMALNDRILSGGAGDEAVTLQGGGVGNVDLGGGVNNFTIAKDASFTALDRVLLGDDGLWQVNGNLFLGGAAYLTEEPLSYNIGSEAFGVTTLVSQTTTVTGELKFTSTATYSPDVYFLQSGAYGGLSDLINVSGDATIAGTVKPQLRLLERTLPLVIIDTDGTSDDTGTTVIGTPVLTYTIGLNGPTGDGSTIDLLVSADFTMDGMTNNQRRTALQFNHILEGQGSQAMGPMFTLIALMEDEADIIDAIDRLGSEDYAATLVEARGALLQFSDEMLTCERELPEGGCSWLRFQGHELTYGANDEWRALGSHSRGLSGGVRVPLRDDLAIGLGARIEEFTMTSGERFRAEGARLSLGVSLMRTVGPWTIYGMATGSSGSYKTERVIGISGALIDGIPVEAGTVTARQEVTSLNLRAGVTYDADLGRGFYLQPGVRLDATHLHSAATTEAGSDFGLVLAGTGEWVTTLTPSVEFGFGQATASGGNLRAYGRLEVSLADRDSLFINATFPGASMADGLFTNDSQFGRETWRAEAGVTYTSGDGSRFVNAAVRHEWGDRGSADSLSISAGFRF